MKTSRRVFLESTVAAPAAVSSAAPFDATRPDALTAARRHPLIRTQPTPDFFEGMLLGNGDIGVCVTVRPDALGLHIGKSDVWDIRVSEDHEKEDLPFAKVLELWKQGGDEAKRRGEPEAIHLENRPPLREYYDKVRSSYSKPWPRPWPCGI